MDIEAPISAEKPWPADRPERRQVGKLVPYARNSRTHSAEQVAQIAAAIREWGFTQPVLVDENDTIIVGHARVMAATRLGLDEVPVVVARGWSEAQIRAYVIADNKLAENAGWNDEMLRLELGDLSRMGFEIELTGFSTDELGEMVFGSPGGAAGGDGEEVDDVERGALLDLLNVSIAEPRAMERGDHYLLDGRHHLIVEGVIDGWPRWLPLLAEGMLFCPYPGVFVPFGSKAEAHPLLMVQPDPYIAGHILDRWAEIKGEATITKAAR